MPGQPGVRGLTPSGHRAPLPASRLETNVSLVRKPSRKLHDLSSESRDLGCAMLCAAMCRHGIAAASTGASRWCWAAAKCERRRRGQPTARHSDSGAKGPAHQSISATSSSSDGGHGNPPQGSHRNSPAAASGSSPWVATGSPRRAPPALACAHGLARMQAPEFRSVTRLLGTPSGRRGPARLGSRFGTRKRPLRANGPRSATTIGPLPRTSPQAVAVACRRGDGRRQGARDERRSERGECDGATSESRVPFFRSVLSARRRARSSPRGSRCPRRPRSGRTRSRCPSRR
jgi:hypothetical protein